MSSAQVRFAAAVASIALLTLAACGQPRAGTMIPAKAQVSTGNSHRDAPRPCQELVPGCQATRLPDATLAAGETRGALGPTTGMSTSGLISFNDALGRAGEEDPWTHAKTVQ